MKKHFNQINSESEILTIERQLLDLSFEILGAIERRAPGEMVRLFSESEELTKRKIGLHLNTIDELTGRKGERAPGD
mgnify:CR=1 FL=1